jgi:predicted nicotinamide N-methyase
VPLLPPRPRVFDVDVAVRVHPLVPEIPLHLLAAEVDLSRHVDALWHVELAPCWPFAWGGGAALARYVLDHPESVRGRHVVDFGAGSGLVGIAAKRAGAARVVCVDLDADALVACRANAELSGVVVETSESCPAAWDLLLAADVLYESDNTDVLAAIAQPGRALLLAEALRPGAPRPDRAPLAHYAVATFPDVDVPVTEAFVFAFEGREAWETAFRLRAAGR